MQKKIKAIIATLAVAPALAVGAWQVAANATAQSSAASEFHAVAPTRVLDTRNGTGAPAGAVATSSTTVLDLSATVPADATAVSVNVTVTAATAGGYIEAYADGSVRPTASTLNFDAAQTVANSSMVQLLDDKVDIFNGSGGTVQLIADVTGYFESAGASASPPPTSLSAAPSASASASPSPSGGPTSGSPSATASNSATPAGYVEPGSVGYLGSTSLLTVYKPGGAAPVDCNWQSYGLRCDDASMTWDHVWIQGSVYWTGTGTLKVTQSIIRGGTNGSWYALLGHPSSSGALPGATIDVEDSTLGWLPGVAPAPNVDAAPVWTAYGNQRQVIIRDDLSGMAQGIDPTDSSVIEDNYIHGLVQNGTGTTVVHLDGIFSQGGGNILIKGNYVDAPVRGDTTGALFIQDRGATDTGISIQDNYLNGGAYVLRNQTGLSVDVEGNTFGAGVYGLVGDLTGYSGTYGTWTGNVDSTGATVAKP